LSPVGSAISATAGSATAAEAGLPWPKGDSGGLSDAAGQAHSAAQLLRTTGSRLTTASGSAAGWHGEGAQAFQSAASQEHAQMAKAAVGLEEAGAALKRLSREVSDAQELVARLAQEVIDADEEARRAAARATLAEISAIAAGARLALAGPDPSESLKTSAGDAADEAGAASGAASDAQAHANAVRERNTRKAQEACDQVEREDKRTAAAVNAAGNAAPLAGIRAGQPTPANTFAQATLGDLSLDQWRAIAYWQAGIDGGAWNPAAGLRANDPIVQAVYAYYGNLFLEHPELQWSGMANMAGAMFYGRWQDLYAIRHVADDGERAKYFSELVGLPKLPDQVYDAAGLLPMTPVSLAGHLTSEELEWYEDRFLAMQREIFDDLGWQHAAYALGGVGLMQQLRDHNVITEDRNLRAWEAIGSGDPDRVAAGNRELLYREQRTIIQDDYDAMRGHHGPVGDAFTYTATVIADNPIPGGHSYRHDYPLRVEIDPTPTVPIIGWDPPGDIHITTPLPSGNISNFDDRWAWIDSDMLPSYQHLLHQPGAVQGIVSTPVAERADTFRLVPDLPYSHR
jgi:uncharacterized protein YukE